MDHTHPTMTARATIWFFLILALGLASMRVAAEDLITKRAIFEDKHGDMTLEQVTQAKFSQANKVISKGYTGSVIWIRLTVDAPDEVRTLVLYLLPTTLDEVMLFSPDSSSPGPYASATPGERYAGASQGKRLLRRASLIDIAPGQTIHYLRIKTKGPMLMSSMMMTEVQAHREEITRGIVLGAFLACCVLVMIGLLAMIAIRREALYIIFLLHLAVSIALFLNGFGYLKEYFDPGYWFSSYIVGSLLALTNIFTTFLFFWALLGRFGLPRWGRILSTLFFIFYTPLFLLFFVLDRQTILFLSTTLGVIASAFCLPLTVAVFYRKKRDTWPLAALILLVMLLALRIFFTLYGIVAPDELTINLLAARVIFIVAIFGAILWLSDREKQDVIRTSITNEAVLRQLAEFEKNRREIQESFMTMLMHELKTPLSIIQLAATSLGRRLAFGTEDAARVRNINRSVDDLNAIIERCAQADQIEQGAILMEKQNFSLKNLIDDVLQTLDAGRITLLGPHGFVLFSDYQYVRIILLNLLNNALKYSPPDSMVEFKIQNAPLKDVAGLTFSVSNTVGNAGMPDPAQVFVRYYRSDGARRYVGAGLGLWLAQTVARQLGSEVHFLAKQAQVCFSFRLELA